MRRKAPVIRYKHDAMIDMVIADPTIKQSEIAARFGYSKGWVSMIFCSDEFKARLEERKNELIDPTLRLSTDELIRALTARSIKVLIEKLDDDPENISDNLALQSAALGTKSMGYGVTPSVQIGINNVDLRAAMEEAQARRKAYLDEENDCAVKKG